MPRQDRRQHETDDWARFFVGLAVAIVIAAGFWILVAAILRALAT